MKETVQTWFEEQYPGAEVCATGRVQRLDGGCALTVGAPEGVASAVGSSR